MFMLVILIGWTGICFHRVFFIKALLELMIMCRGDNTATVETLAGGFCFINQEVH